ncbi:reverse transcriptase Ty1/copia-type domain-containing protein [Citrus sinensis]|nr:reverse transcriptase Ty1/copia-type domain-containing protein [Citrus sinensis]
MEKTTNPTQEFEIFSSSVIRQDISSVCLGETKALDVLDPGYPQWDAENSMVQAWLINSMDVDIGRSYLFLQSAKELWEAVIETYSDLGNAAQLFEFKSQLRHQKRHGKPADWKPKRQQEVKGMVTEKTNQFALTKDQFEMLQQLLIQNQQPKRSDLTSSSCNVVHTSNPSALSIQSFEKGHWIVDSGASDYMTWSYQFFSSYTPCPVLHVPNLKCNLLSDPILGRMTGNAKEYEGLYYLENKGPVKGHAQVSQCEFVSSKIMLCTIVKYKADGSVDSYKARLVAKGFTQTYGVDYLKTFAPVAKLNTSPRTWFDRFGKVLKTYGYSQGQADHTMFYKQSKEGKLAILIVYVDNIILTGDDKEELEGLNAKLACEFEIKNLGPLRYFLGMEVARTAKGILVTQRKYTLDMLKDTGMIDCKLDVTLVEPNRKLGLEENSAPKERGRYQRLVGRLIYLSHTRLDIAFAVSLVSQFIHSPREAHLVAVNRILQYLKSTPGKGLYFDKGEKKNIEAFVDVD